MQWMLILNRVKLENKSTSKNFKNKLIFTFNDTGLDTQRFDQKKKLH